MELIGAVRFSTLLEHFSIFYLLLLYLEHKMSLWYFQLIDLSINFLAPIINITAGIDDLDGYASEV